MENIFNVCYTLGHELGWCLTKRDFFIYLYYLQMMYVSSHRGQKRLFNKDFIAEKYPIIPEVKEHIGDFYDEEIIPRWVFEDFDFVLLYPNQKFIERFVDQMRYFSVNNNIDKALKRASLEWKKKKNSDDKTITCEDIYQEYLANKGRADFPLHFIIDE